MNQLVASARTKATGRLTKIVTVNDLQGIDLMGDATFRNALSASSKKANALGFSSLAGPTLLVNLPRLLGALVKIFKPLFPKTVQEKLKFENGPLKGVTDLTALHGSSGAREKFLGEVEALLS